MQKLVATLARRPQFGKRLAVELTETAVVRNVGEAARFIAALRDLGVKTGHRRFRHRLFVVPHPEGTLRRPRQDRRLLHHHASDRQASRGSSSPRWWKSPRHSIWKQSPNGSATRRRPPGWRALGVGLLPGRVLRSCNLRSTLAGRRKPQRRQSAVRPPHARNSASACRPPRYVPLCPAALSARGDLFGKGPRRRLRVRLAADGRDHREDPRPPPQTPPPHAPLSARRWQRQEPDSRRPERRAPRTPPDVRGRTWWASQRPDPAPT